MLKLGDGVVITEGMLSGCLGTFVRYVKATIPGSDDTVICPMIDFQAPWPEVDLHMTLAIPEEQVKLFLPN